ncbi:Glutamate receptor 2 [Folsomia candida]|uniref:Glutamate receptor 2 n=1 Tax=Folsomia candida TaxID=158441 RepID=A0A226EBC1_FOLCA|nr:Glutamate receptor 2 [Folsomia candida]
MPVTLLAHRILFVFVVFFTDQLFGFDRIVNFIRQISRNEASECGIFFIRKAKLGEAKDGLIRNVVVNQIGAVVPYYGAEYLESEQNVSNQLLTYPPSANLMRMSPICKLAVISMGDSPDGVDKFLREIKNQNTDYWIWISSNLVELDQLLLSPVFPDQINYKVGVALDQSGNLVIRSVCFFCDNGNPTFLTYSNVRDPFTFTYFPDFTENLNGKIITLSVPRIVSLIEQDPDINGGIRNIKRGRHKQLFNDYLTLALNFTYHAIPSTGHGTGVRLANGTMIGTMGDLMSGKADISVVTARSRSRRASTLVSLLVFKMITVSLNMLGMSDVMSYSHRGVISTNPWGIRHQIFFVLTTYLDQDCVLPRCTPLRCMAALWLFFTLIITTIYRSKMVSLLAFPLYEDLPESYEDLVNSDYTYAFLREGDSGWDFLRASTHPVFVKFVANMEVIGAKGGLDCMRGVVTKRKYACIIYSISSPYVIARNMSDAEARDLVLAPETTYMVFVGIALQGGSIYRTNLDRWLSRIHPFHLEAIWTAQDEYETIRLPRIKWLQETNQTDEMTRDLEEVNNLTLKHILGAFYALAACLLISLVLFLHELIRFRMRCSNFGEIIFPHENIQKSMWIQ